MIQRDEYEKIMTKLKRVQKENDLLRYQKEALQREADYWEHQTKSCQSRLAQIEAKFIHVLEGDKNAD